MASSTESDQAIVLAKGQYHGPTFRGLDAAAVIVVDMTNDFGHPDGVYPRHGASCETLRALIDPVRRILEAAHGAGVPTIAVNQVIYAGRSGRHVTGGGMVEARPWLADEGLRPGTWGAQLVDDLPRTDFALEKPRASGFYATPLDVLLRGLDTKTVIIVGAYTNQCVVSTARDAWARDFKVVVVTDGVTAFDEALHRATLESLKPLSTQLTSDQVLEMLGKAAAPAGI